MWQPNELTLRPKFLTMPLADFSLNFLNIFIERLKLPMIGKFTSQSRRTAFTKS